MRVDLGTSPKVVRIASALRADRLRVVGGLHAVWCLFDVHSTDGRLDGYTQDALDELIAFPGFADAMIAVGWLEKGDGYLCTPRFEEHNGQSAKRRAMETERKRESRKMSASEADKKRAREEKRREDIPTTNVVGSAPKPRALRKCPADFSVTEDLARWAQEHAPLVNTLDETDKFRDHTFGSARADWPGTWRNWMRRAQDYAEANRRKPLQSGHETAFQRAQRETIEGLAPGVARRQEAPSTIGTPQGAGYVPAIQGH